MDATEDTHTPVSDTSKVLLTIDAVSLSETSITTDNFIIAEHGDLACQNFSTSVVLPCSHFVNEHLCFLVRTSKLDGALQRFVPASMRAQVFYLCHFTTMGGHTESRKIYDTMRRQ